MKKIAFLVFLLVGCSPQPGRQCISEGEQAYIMGQKCFDAQLKPECNPYSSTYTRAKFLEGYLSRCQK